MACYSPLQAYQLVTREILFVKPVGRFSTSLQLPCGQCIGCRLERSRQWAVRMMHEASLYEENCFITLTFSSENLPKDSSLDVKIFQDFMKRLRKRFGNGIRFFHCGEYGERYKRPHYHAILFNFDFKDKYLWEEKNGHKLYRSPSLEELWPFGHSLIGSVTFDSAAYVARYITKKITGDAAEPHYRIFNDDTGEITGYRKPEYTTMSRRPGIGKGWIDFYMNDTYKDDKVIVKGFPCKPPRFYDSQFEILDPDGFVSIKLERKRKAKKFSADNTPERLKVKEKCKRAEISKLARVVDEAN